MRLQPTVETELEVTRLIVQDYYKQLEELKRKKVFMEYKDYRFLYVKLHQGIANNKKKIRRLLRNVKNQEENSK